MKKIQPPGQAGQCISNSPRSKANARTPPPSYQFNSASSNVLNQANSHYLQKPPFKGKNNNISKRTLTPSESNRQVKSASSTAQYPNFAKPEFLFSEVRPTTPFSPISCSNQNMNGNKYLPNAKVPKSQSSSQASKPLQQCVKPPKQPKSSSQRKKKMQPPSIQRPVPSQRSYNSKNQSRRCISPKFDPASNFPSVNSPEFHYYLEKKLEICSQPLLLTRYCETLDPNTIATAPKKMNEQKSKENKTGITIDDIQLKTLILTQVLRLVTDNVNNIKDDEQDMIIDMIMSNILRPQRYVNPNLLFSEVPQILPDPEWPHLDVVYLILAQMQNYLPYLLTYAFCKALFPVMNSAETNERIELINFFKEYINIHVESRKELMFELTQILNMHIELSDRPYLYLKKFVI